MLAITATATNINRRKIKQKLCMMNSIDYTESPDRNNISLFVSEIPHAKPLEEVF